MMQHRRAPYMAAITLAGLLGPLQIPAYQTVSTPPQGQVQGKVVLDSDGSAVTGVTITLIQISSTPRATATNPMNSGAITTTPVTTTPVTSTPVTGVSATAGASSAATTATAITANDGSFGVASLATGQFEVSVKDPNTAVIDPCLWTDSRTTVSVSASSLTSGLVVRVKKASGVTVRVNDTAQALVQQSTDRYPPHVLVGAFDARGGFHPARQVAKDATGVSYQLSIPVHSPIRVTVYSAQVKLATASSVAVPAQGYSTTFVQPSRQTQTNSFTFNAVGRN